MVKITSPSPVASREGGYSIELQPNLEGDSRSETGKQMSYEVFEEERGEAEQPAETSLDSIDEPPPPLKFDIR